MIHVRQRIGVFIARANAEYIITGLQQAAMT